MVGGIFTAGAAWLLLGAAGASWQLFVAACAAPAAAAAALVLLALPESPRFLHTRGDAAGARAALLRIARANGAESRLARGWELEPPPPPQVAAAAGARACSLAPARAFCAAPNRRSATLLSVVWFCLSLGWYGLYSWLPLLFKATGLELNIYQDAFLVAAAYLPGNIASALLMERVGRRGVLAGSLLLACASAVAFPFAKTEAAVLLAACTLNCVSTCSWNALDCLSAEAFPTELRTTALGLLAAAGRVGSVAGQWLFGSLIDVSVVALLGCAGGVLGAGALAAWALPAEVRSRQLQETTAGAAAAAAEAPADGGKA